MLRWIPGDLRELHLDEIGTEFARYRVPDMGREQVMARSLKRFGQIAPVVVWLRDRDLTLLDGFKRLQAARTVGLKTLATRLVEADERSAKAAIYGLNQAGGHTSNLEEAWIVHALVRDDGLSQVEVAELLGRHKSWVCRRVQMIEKLSEKSLDDLRLGLVSPAAARQLIRLPAGNQDEILQVAQRESLSCQELQGVVDLWLTSAHRQQKEFLLEKPREAMAMAKGIATPSFDPRLSAAGNRISKRLGVLLDVVSRMRSWIELGSGDDLLPSDLTLLLPSFERMAKETAALSEICECCLLKGRLRERADTQRDNPTLVERDVEASDRSDPRDLP